MTTVAQPHAPEEAQDRPRSIRPGIPLSDRAFRGIARAGGLSVLVITGGIGIFLAYRSQQALGHYGWKFFTENQWIPESDRIGIKAVVIGTLEVAAVAILVAFPLALLTALYITEYAPARVRSLLVALVDLMAAVPSVVYGLWGFAMLQPQIIYLSRWLHTKIGSVLPIFAVDSEPDAAVWQQSDYTSSMFIVGVVVGMMVLPICCSVMREVFSQTPAAEREGALALGSTRWGVIRAVVLPFGRGGIIGGTMLGLGRALGETIAVAMIIAPAFDIKIRILEKGGITVSSLIALRYGESSEGQLSALMAAGLVLFVITLIVNTLASMIVARSRSGAATEL